MNEQMVKILLPRGRKNEENFVIVSVNGRSWTYSYFKVAVSRKIA